MGEEASLFSLLFHQYTHIEDNRLTSEGLPSKFHSKRKDLVRQLSQETKRNVLITAPFQSGKTALATLLVAHLKQACKGDKKAPDGNVLFISFAGLIPPHPVTAKSLGAHLREQTAALNERFPSEFLFWVSAAI